MRTLLLTDKFAPHAGGTAVVWSEYCKRWPPESVRVLTRWYPGCEDYDRRHAYSIVRLPYLNIPKIRMPLLWLRLFAGAVRECRRHPPDLIHCGQILETGGYAHWINRRFGVPYMIHTYGEELNNFGRKPRPRQRMQRILRGACGITTISNYSEDVLRRVVGYEGAVEIVNPGVDVEKFVPGDGGGIRRRLGLGDDPLLITVSRLVRRKGHDRALEAIPIIRRRIPNIRYLIIGIGPEELRLRHLVESAGFQNVVRFLGRVSDDELVSLLQSADVFIHPNRELENGDVEGFGIVFLEANACGLPVIGGNSGGTPDAIQDGATGFLVDPNSPDEIAEKTIMLLQDEGLRRRMGEAGREWAAQFTWEKAAQKVWDLSLRAVAGKNPIAIH